tara:strand:- start:258 stop:467 length:210 start_codon:yes stop_codon:yes gene_type:complete
MLTIVGPSASSPGLTTSKTEPVELSFRVTELVAEAPLPETIIPYNLDGAVVTSPVAFNFVAESGPILNL